MHEARSKGLPPEALADQQAASVLARQDEIRITLSPLAYTQLFVDVACQLSAGHFKFRAMLQKRNLRRPLILMS